MNCLITDTHICADGFNLNRYDYLIYDATDGKDYFDFIFSVFLICYSVDESNSFKNIVSKWIPKVMDKSFLIVGTKADIFYPHNSKHVSAERAEKLCKEVHGYASMRCSAYKFTTSKQEQDAVDNIFKEAARCAFTNQVLQSTEVKPSCFLC